MASSTVHIDVVHSPSPGVSVVVTPGTSRSPLLSIQVTSPANSSVRALPTTVDAISGSNNSSMGGETSVPSISPLSHTLNDGHNEISVDNSPNASGSLAAVIIMVFGITDNQSQPQPPSEPLMDEPEASPSPQPQSRQHSVSFAASSRPLPPVPVSSNLVPSAPYINTISLPPTSQLPALPVPQPAPVQPLPPVAPVQAATNPQEGPFRRQPRNLPTRQEHTSAFARFLSKTPFFYQGTSYKDRQPKRRRDANDEDEDEERAVEGILPLHMGPGRKLRKRRATTRTY